MAIIYTNYTNTNWYRFLVWLTYNCIRFCIKKVEVAFIYHSHHSSSLIACTFCIFIKHHVLVHTSVGDYQYAHGDWVTSNCCITVVVGVVKQILTGLHLKLMFA